MFNGTNASGKEFDVIDEDGEVMSSHDEFADAADALRLAAGFFLSRGVCRLRRDQSNAPKGAFVRLCIPREWG